MNTIHLNGKSMQRRIRRKATAKANCRNIALAKKIGIKPEFCNANKVDNALHEIHAERVYLSGNRNKKCRNVKGFSKMVMPELVYTYSELKEQFDILVAMNLEEF